STRSPRDPRLSARTGARLGPEYRVTSALDALCANPSVCGTHDGRFTVVWSQRANVRAPESWDIYGRNFSGNAEAASEALRINSTVYGDQFGPKTSHIGDHQLVVWTSIGQDRSREGAYGQALSAV